VSRAGDGKKVTPAAATTVPTPVPAAAAAAAGHIRSNKYIMHARANPCHAQQQWHVVTGGRDFCPEIDCDCDCGCAIAQRSPSPPPPDQDLRSNMIKCTRHAARRRTASEPRVLPRALRAICRWASRTRFMAALSFSSCFSFSTWKQHSHKATRKDDSGKRYQLDWLDDGVVGCAHHNLPAHEERA
jgi:hypothetical protein